MPRLKLFSFYSMRTFVVAILLVLGFAQAGLAQEFGRTQELLEGNNQTAYFVFARPGEATIQVHVMGAGGSGVYEVSEETDLGTLLVLTGGMMLPPRLKGEERNTTIRLYHREGDRRSLSYEASLEAFVADPGGYPLLREGDVVAIETIEKRRFSWRDLFSIGTAAATIVIAVDRVLKGQ